MAQLTRYPMDMELKRDVEGSKNLIYTGGEGLDLKEMLGLLQILICMEQLYILYIFMY